jgi:hypothetical protein
MSDAVRKLHLTGSDSLQVEGQNDLLVYRARCCNPIRGEEIIGYVTRGKGVAVHARSCPNVQNLLYESDRRIAVEWSRVGDQQSGRPQRYPVKITVFCDDRTGMLKELTAVISDDNTNIRGVEIHRAATRRRRSHRRVCGGSRRRAPPEPHGPRPAPRRRRARRAANAEVPPAIVLNVIATPLSTGQEDPALYVPRKRALLVVVARQSRSLDILVIDSL